MPTYEYKCAQCGRFEKVQPITADPLTECPTCGGKVERLISRNVNILFKGSGFHITDYRSPSYKGDASAGGAKGSQTAESSKSNSNSTAASNSGSTSATQSTSSTGSSSS